MVSLARNPASSSRRSAANPAGTAGRYSPASCRRPSAVRSPRGRASGVTARGAEERDPQVTVVVESIGLEPRALGLPGNRGEQGCSLRPSGKLGTWEVRAHCSSIPWLLASMSRSASSRASPARKPTPNTSVVEWTQSVLLP